MKHTAKQKRKLAKLTEQATVISGLLWHQLKEMYPRYSTWYVDYGRGGYAAMIVKDYEIRAGSPIICMAKEVKPGRYGHRSRLWTRRYLRPNQLIDRLK
jgi:hypothetical protein